MKLSSFLSVRGSVAVPAAARHLSDDEIVSAFERRLEREGAEVTSRTERSLQFTVPFGRGMLLQWQRQFTGALTSGAFAVVEPPGQRRRVDYDLSHARATTNGIVVFGVVLAVSIWSGGTWPPWWVVPVLLSLTFLAGQLTTSMSAPYWIRRAISDAMERRE